MTGTLHGHARPYTLTLMKQPDLDLKKNLQAEQVVVLTADTLIEATLHYPKGVPLSDALNSVNTRDSPYMALNDVRVMHLQSGKEVLRVNFLLLSCAQVLCIMPKSEVLSAPLLDGTAEAIEGAARPNTSQKERRGGLRRKGTPIAVLITDAAATAPPFGGWVVERSRTGLGMLVDRPIGVGTRLNIKPSEAGANFPWILVDVKSCRPDKDNARLGCHFVSKVPWSLLLKFG